MTDVEGPFAPPVRPSSLLMQTAGGAEDIGTGRSELKISRDMAQSFKIPVGQRTVPDNVRTRPRYPGQTSRSPPSADPDRRPKIWVGRRLTASAGRDRPA